MRGATSAMLCTIVFSLSLSCIDTIEGFTKTKTKTKPKFTDVRHKTLYVNTVPRDACDVSSTTITTTTRLI